MSEKGINKTWTPEQEQYFQNLLQRPLTLADRVTVKGIYNVLKYDGRFKVARVAQAQQKLLIATATDKELEQLAELRYKLSGDSESVEQKLADLKEIRAKFQQEGVKVSELTK